MKYILASPQGPICSMAPDTHILYSLLNCASTHYVQSLTPGTHTFCTVSHIKHPHIMYNLSHLAHTLFVQSLRSGTHTLCTVSHIWHSQSMYGLSHLVHKNSVQSLTSGPLTFIMSFTPGTTQSLTSSTKTICRDSHIL